ncbi:MAG: hypothetical protein [Bacteriophage sp.]|nr:MAG: hypothetical protein [Bacteriophage sp.]
MYSENINDILYFLDILNSIKTDKVKINSFTKNTKDNELIIQLERLNVSDCDNKTDVLDDLLNKDRLIHKLFISTLEEIESKADKTQILSYYSRLEGNLTFLNFKLIDFDTHIKEITSMPSEAYSHPSYSNTVCGVLYV